MIDDLLALHETWPFDLILRDTTDYAGPLVAEATGIPHATAGFTDFRPRAFFQSTGADLVAVYRSELGLEPDPSLECLWRYLVLASTAPSLVRDTDYVSPVTHFIRPALFDQSGDEELPEWVLNLGERALIYATLGTVASRFTAASRIFRAIIDAVETEPVDLILTVGRGQPVDQFGPTPANVHIAQYIPQTLLLPRCDLVITHGGFNTTIAALAHGLPLIVTPIAADQFENAQRVEQAGAGVVIGPEQRAAAAIRRAVRETLNNPTYRESAERIHREMDGLPGLDHAVDLLERLASEKQPLVPIET